MNYLKLQADAHKDRSTYTIDDRTRKALEFIKEERPHSILDVGCYASPLKDSLNGPEIYGVDCIPGDGVDLVADLNKRLLLDRTFDLVYAGEIIEHLFDPMGFLSNMGGALKVGGVLVLSTPNLTALGNRVRMLLGRRIRFLEKCHHSLLTYADLMVFLRWTGFKVERVSSSYLFFSRQRNPPVLRKMGSVLGSWFPRYGYHIIVKARKWK